MLESSLETLQKNIRVNLNPGMRSFSPHQPLPVYLVDMWNALPFPEEIVSSADITSIAEKRGRKFLVMRVKMKEKTEIKMEEESGLEGDLTVVRTLSFRKKGVPKVLVYGELTNFGQSEGGATILVGNYIRRTEADQHDISAFNDWVSKAGEKGIDLEGLGWDPLTLRSHGFLTHPVDFFNP